MTLEENKRITLAVVVVPLMMYKIEKQSIQLIEWELSKKIFSYSLLQYEYFRTAEGKGFFVLYVKNDCGENTKGMLMLFILGMAAVSSEIFRPETAVH